MNPPQKKKKFVSINQKILKESIRLIEREGLDRFSLRKLAEKIKMDPMAVYHYFSSKKELMFSCLQLVFKNFSPNKDSVSKGKPKTKTNLKLSHSQQPEPDFLILQEMIDSYRKKYLQYPNLCKYLLIHPESIPPEIEEYNHMLIREIDRLVSNLEEARLIRDILVDFLHGFCLAEISIAKKNKIQNLELESKFQKSIHFLVRKLLRS
ncbi:TetR/AcrR family transcriptional regulator [Leptospira ognonensis]|uniref:TetR/AcrR family transcriptional regulator n=1 Tax=Leptospira ognonensis TaxID=2484945 RepID=A0A4R9K4R2_9LEPT|nr:TetR/AcrR family transcriptional regulator [Leptospira ognonensis]TGL59308.1 TetR/AcrR family transcriptional regulator [Leptospira ognonensis]